MPLNSKFGIAGYSKQTEEYQVNKYPSYSYTFRGTQSEIRASGSVFYGQGWDVRYESGDVWTLTATINSEIDSNNNPVSVSGSVNTVNWSIHYNTTDKELLHCSTDNIPFLANLTANDRLKLEYDLNNPAKGVPPDFSTYSSGGSASAAVIYNMWTSGQRSIQVTTPVLRKTMVVSSLSDLTGYQANIFRYYSKSSLATSIGIPSNWSSAMPQGTDPSSSGTNGITYYYGWLKQPPTQDQNGTTITIQQEFVYGLYPSNTYGTRL